jgi:hypothetical protein
MEYKKILQWILLGLLMVNCDFGANADVAIYDATKARQTYFDKAQEITEGTFFKSVKKLGVNPAPASAAAPSAASTPANTKPAISPAVKAGTTVMATGGAAAGITRWLYSGKNVNGTNEEKKQEVKYSTEILDEFEKNNQVFKTIYDYEKDKATVNKLKITLPHYTLGQQNRGNATSSCEIKYSELMTAYQEIDDNKQNPRKVSEKSTQIIASFSRLEDTTQELIKAQQKKVTDIQQLVGEINTNLQTIKGGRDEISRLFYGLIKKELIDERTRKEQSIKYIEGVLLKSSADQNKAPVNKGQLDPNLKQLEEKPQPKFKDLDEVIEKSKREEWLRRSKIVQLENDINYIKSQLTFIEKLNDNSHKQIGNYVYDSILNEIDAIQVGKNVFTSKSMTSSILSGFQSFTKGEQDPKYKKFISKIPEGSISPLEINWKIFFPTDLNLTSSGNITKWTEAIENASNILTVLNNFCKLLVAQTIGSDIQKNTQMKAFCREYFTYRKESSVFKLSSTQTEPYPFNILSKATEKIEDKEEEEEIQEA